MVGGIDHEAELAAARLRMKAEKDAGSLQESQRLRREEADEQFMGRLWAMTSFLEFRLLLWATLMATR